MFLRAGVLALCMVPHMVTFSAPLPDPLTLQYAIKLVDEPHPAVSAQLAKIKVGQAELAAVSARKGLNAHLDLYPQYGRFAAARDRDLKGDSIARLTLLQPITDFGRRDALMQAAGAEVKHNEILLSDLQAQRRIEITRLFFDVLLADLRFHVEDEIMTSLFGPYDRARERAELGMVSQVDLLRLETEFREALIPRARSDHERRIARIRLAIALNRPNEIPANLVRPKFADLEKELPEYDQLVEAALSNNPKLSALREKVTAAQHTVLAQRALRRPVLSGGLELTEWEQEVGSRSDVLLGLRLRVPIYQGGTEKVAVAKAEAELASRKADLELMEIELKHSILEVLHKLETLKTARRTSQTRLQFRELAADEQRAKYEMEVQTTVGASVARLTEADFLAMKTEFETVINWMQLDALRGQIASILTEK